MKHLTYTYLLAILVSIVGTTASFGHDIEAANDDGVTIYYVFNDDQTELAVSYRGSSYSEYSNEYSGFVVIPSSVTYGRKTYSVTSIGDRAFFKCSSLISITIPSSVTSLGGYAFSGCTGLTSVTIPNSVTRIRIYAFSDCSRLTSVTIPNSVTTIESSVFSDCSSLTSVTIPNSVTKIESSAFSDCSSLTSVTIGNSVKSIGFYAFSGCSSLRSVTIPNSVTKIEDKTFYKCSSLRSVSIPNSVRSIGSSALADCSSLTSVRIPNSVTWIDSSAFAGCSGLTSVTIPNSVGYIGRYAFSGCSSLISVTIPNSVNGISDYAFYECSSLRSVTIPNSVTHIEQGAFAGCSNLSSFTIPNSVTGIGPSAFSGCNNLASITIPNSVTGIGQSAFSGCSSLRSVTIPNSVFEIRDYTFARCSNLNSVTIGSCVLSIGRDVFLDHQPTKVIWLRNTPPVGYGNASGVVNYVTNNQYSLLNNKTVYPLLESIFEKDGIKYVPVRMVYYSNHTYDFTCDAIDCIYGNECEKVNISKTVTYQGYEWSVLNMKPYCCYDNDYITDIQLSFQGLIGNYAFMDCGKLSSAKLNHKGDIGISAFESSGLQNVEIGSSVTDISEKAFYNCTRLTTSTFNHHGYIGKSAFEGTKLQKIELGKSVTDIKERAFFRITSQASAILNNSGSVGTSAFESSNLEQVQVGRSVNTIGERAFYNCKALTSATLDNKGAIGISAFENTGLREIGIGEAITDIASRAFYNCTSLTTARIDNKGSVGASAFANCSSLNQFVILRNVKSVGNEAFKLCRSLKTFIMEDDGEIGTTLSLGSNGISPLFADCPLDSVYIGRNISYNTSSDYGFSPFYRNTSLRSTVVTGSETEISDNEFYGCANLKNVRIGNKVTKIGDWAFSGCCSLDFFAFAGKVKSIGKEAFSDCTNINKIVSLATTPPLCGTQALDDINKWVCTLKVPTGALTAYQAANQWKEFFSIQEGATRKDVDKDMDVTLSSLGYATFYDSETNYTLPQGLTAYTVTGTQNDKIVYEEVAIGADRGIVPKGIAVMLKSDKMQAGTFTLVQTDVTKSYTGENLLHGSDETTMTSADGDSYFYKLAFGAKGSELENVFGWYWGADNGAAFKMDAHKAWLAIPKEQAHKIRAFNIEGDATAIADLEEETSGAETDNAIYYDLQGRRITHPNRRGIYIRNGKKVAFAK